MGASPLLLPTRTKSINGKKYLQKVSPGFFKPPGLFLVFGWSSKRESLLNLHLFSLSLSLLVVSQIVSSPVWSNFKSLLKRSKRLQKHSQNVQNGSKHDFFKQNAAKTDNKGKRFRPPNQKKPSKSRPKNTNGPFSPKKKQYFGRGSPQVQTYHTKIVH